MIPVYSGFGLDRLHCNILNQSSDLQCKYDKKKKQSYDLFKTNRFENRIHICINLNYEIVILFVL